MAIEQTVIDRLLAESKEAQNEDFQTGRVNCQEWAENSPYIYIRDLYKRAIDAQYDTVRRKQGLAEWLHQDTIDAFGGLDADEFAQMLGCDVGDLNVDELAIGLLKGVIDFCTEAKTKGVPF